MSSNFKRLKNVFITSATSASWFLEPNKKNIYRTFSIRPNQTNKNTFLQNVSEVWKHFKNIKHIHKTFEEHTKSWENVQKTFRKRLQNLLQIDHEYSHVCTLDRFKLCEIQKILVFLKFYVLNLCRINTILFVNVIYINCKL